MSERGGFLDSTFSFLRRKRTAPTRTHGVGGTAVYGGYVEETETEPELRDTRRYKTYSDILANVTIVGAAVRLYLNMVSKSAWTFAPAKGDDVDEGDAQEMADTVRKILTEEMGTPWTRVVRRAAMYRYWGFSISEWTAMVREDGSIGFLDVEPRAQRTIERWDTDETGTVFGAIQRSPQDAEELYIPRSRMLYVVDDALNDSPEGLGLFRHIVSACRTLKRFEQLEGFGFETDLRGVPVGYAPIAELDELVDSGDMTEGEKEQYLVGLRRFLQNHVKDPSLSLLFDSETFRGEGAERTPTSTRKWGVELITGSATSFEAVAAAIERKTREIARVLGVEGLLLGSTGTGSLALSKSKADQLADVVDSALGEIKESVQRDLIDRLFELNPSWGTDLKPKANYGTVQKLSPEELAAALRDLSSASSILGPEDEAFAEIFALFGLTPPVFDPDEEDLALTGLPIPPGAPAPPVQNANAPSEEDGGAENQLETEE